jgi:hypothetical protein
MILKQVFYFFHCAYYLCTMHTYMYNVAEQTQTLIQFRFLQLYFLSQWYRWALFFVIVNSYELYSSQVEI